MKSIRPLLALSVFTFFLIGCQQSRVTHVVVAWLKEPGNQQQQQQLIDLSKTFKAIPGVVDVTAGRTLPSTRPVVDTSYDVAIVIRLTDREALQTYTKHPIHVEAAEKTFNPLVERFVIYDFEE